MKATVHCLPDVTLFIMLNNVVLSFESEDEVLIQNDHSKESYWCCFNVVQVGSNFDVCA